MKCAIHLDKDASTLCNHCGRSICSDCLVVKRNENYCQECASGSVLAKEKRSAPLAGVLSFVVAGLGQVYNGQAGKGVLIFLTSILVVPWIIGIFDAYGTAKKINAGQIPFVPKKGCLIAFAVGSCLFMFVVFVVFFMGMFLIAMFAAMDETGSDTSSSEAAVELIPDAIFESYGQQKEILKEM